MVVPVDSGGEGAEGGLGGMVSLIGRRGGGEVGWWVGRRVCR